MKAKAISKILFYILVFLVPLFFFPNLQSFLDFPKQVLLVFLFLLSFLSFFFFVFQKGEIQFKVHPLHFIFLLFYFFFLVSFLLSPAKFNALFGLPFNSSISLISVSYFLLIYFFLNFAFEKEEFVLLLFLFSLSNFLVLISAIPHLFGKFLIPLSFPVNLKEINFFGSQNSFSLFLAIFLPFLAGIFHQSKGFVKWLFGIFIFFSICFLVLISHKPSWFVLLISSLVSLSLLLAKDKKVSFAFFMIFVALSVLFSSFKFLPPASPEIGVPLSEILKVTLFSLKEKPFFGQGPLAFNFNYLKWGSIFGERLFVPHFFILASSLGIFGFLFYFIFLLFPLFWGIKFWNNFSQETLFLPVFFGLFGFVLAQFFYPFSFSLYFSFFLFLGIFANLTSKKEITFSLHNFYFTFLALIVLVFVFWSSILAGKSLLSEYFYFKGLLSWRDGNLEKTIEFLTKAYNLNPKIDYYSRDLAQAFLAKANQKVAKNDFNILDEVKRSIELSKEATENNPLNSANFAVKAFVYHSLAGIVKGAEEAGIKSWQETIEREPRNPYYWTQKGILHLRLAILGEDKEENFQKAEDSFKKALEIVPDYAPARFQMAVLSQAKGEIEKAIAQLEETKLISPFDVGVKFQLGVLYYQKKDYEKAKKELEEAITLFPDYSNALYFLGLTLDALGQKEEAIKKFERVAQLNPEVKEIQQIIENLKQGKPALEGIGQSVPPTTPIESAPAEIKK